MLLQRLRGDLGTTNCMVVTVLRLLAIKSDGSVVTWGDSGAGGDSSSVAGQLQEGVVQVTGARAAFAAIKSDGSVVTWGKPNWGGDSSSVASQLEEGVVQVIAADLAFPW
eukprot:TRINITY_DN284_c0_g1_i35.p1 TRINITY_DN284_c0_g1~~TRINITY_DN284_c0_g1_i35.p1  ORF type:complete len:110 (-),score=20.39 TRINITY_DN284_c0_g1_i35:314-643(-)